MTSLSAVPVSPADRQSGVAWAADLPDDSWRDRWERIFCAREPKSRLLHAALYSLVPKAAVSRVGLPHHGLIVLSGPPGTGKTTLAQGLADRAAQELVSRGLVAGLRLVAIDPHVLPSELLGESQRRLSRLFDRVIPDLAADGRPLVVLLDEVEALAVGRRQVSAETNPVDVQRATDAVLMGVDLVAARHPNVLFIATTNLWQQVDEALMSRADLIEFLGLPGQETIEAILRDTLNEAGDAGAPISEADIGAVAELCAKRRMDARQVRKLVIRAFFSGDIELALGRRGMTARDLRGAAAAMDHELEWLT